MKVSSSFSEEDYLLISGIQHFAFCRRQWALIHIEGFWDENYLTAEGGVLHERVHDPFFVEKRKELILVRDMAIRSRELGATGKCDMVEFHMDRNGVSLFGRDGLWLPTVIEYKRGKPKVDDWDRLQLTAQAICLEEMLCCSKLDKSYLYYSQIRRREEVELTDELRGQVKDIFVEMHDYYRRSFIPKVKPSKGCKSCSLVDLCLPALMKKQSVSQYIEMVLRKENET